VKVLQSFDSSADAFSNDFSPGGFEQPIVSLLFVIANDFAWTICGPCGGLRCGYTELRYRRRFADEFGRWGGFAEAALGFNKRETAMRLIPRADGIALAIKVVPGSSRQRVVGEYAEGLKITVTAAAERGAANEAVIAVLADSLQIAAANIRIVRGHQSPRKEVLIVGLSAEEIERRLSSINE
jgi:hypothetical protein